ncbi:MAG: DJ-1/PfpI family protein [Candidatus Hadarchaeum sp.]|uniref:DJ-1/PfpI family protein n=1 Tax=Candidatus Hadarchaeum sp. TaxID=2883567 RepID=UPI0031706E11
MNKLFFSIIFCFLTIAGLLTGCRKREAEAVLPRVDGKKVVMIVAARNFRDEEFQRPKEILESQGAKVTIASSTLDLATGMLGARVKPDVLVKDIKVEDYDAIVFVGGVGAAEYWEDPVAHRIAREAVEKGKILCAICIAPVTLANAGVLSGKKATVFGAEAEKLKAKGAKYTGAKVEQDGNIITASGPEAAKEFGEAIVRALAKR